MPSCRRASGRHGAVRPTILRGFLYLLLSLVQKQILKHWQGYVGSEWQGDVGSERGTSSKKRIWISPLYGINGPQHADQHCITLEQILGLGSLPRYDYVNKSVNDFDKTVHRDGIHN